MQAYKMTSQVKRGPDLISNLPDSILCLIITLLPTKEAIRTSVLSCRWKDIWKWIPCLDFLPDILKRTTPVVNHVLSLHCVHLDSCRIIHYPVHSSSGDVERWIKHLYEAKEVQKLTLACVPMMYSDTFEWLHYLPAGIFCSRSLRELELRAYVLRDASLFVGCVNLSALTLDSVCLSGDTLTEVIFNCVFLKKLRLQDCIGLQKLMICNQNLKSLEIQFLQVMEMDIQAVNLTTLAIDRISCPLKQIKINTPNLVFFRTYSISGILKLFPCNVLDYGSYWTECRCLRSVEILEHCSGVLSETPYEGHGNGDFAYPIKNLQKIIIDMNLNDTRQSYLLSVIFRVCLRLQELYIYLKTGKEDKLELDSSLYHLPCLEPNYWEYEEFILHHLRRVEIMRFQGEAHEMEFVKHLITKATMLKRLMIKFETKCSTEVLNATRRSLLSLPKASVDLSIKYGYW